MITLRLLEGGMDKRSDNAAAGVASKGELNRMAGGLRRDGSTSSPCTELHPEPVEGSVERLRKS